MSGKDNYTLKLLIVLKPRRFNGSIKTWVSTLIAELLRKMGEIYYVKAFLIFITIFTSN